MSKTDVVVDRPTVPIDGKDYELRFRQKDIVGLKQAGIDITERVTGLGAIERMPHIVAAGLAHLGTISREAVVEFMEGLDMGEYPIYALAVVNAQKKASEEAQKAAEALNQMAKDQEARAKKPNGAIQ